MKLSLAASALTAVLALTAAPAGARSPVPAPGGTAAHHPSDGGAPVFRPAQSVVRGRAAPAPDQWIVELDVAPLSRYDGGVRGLRATAPQTTGRRLDRESSAVRAYRHYLDDRQAAALRVAPGVRPAVEYRAALAGFAAKLSDAQVAALRRVPGVRRVVPERFLELTGATQRAQPTAAARGGIPTMTLDRH